MQLSPVAALEQQFDALRQAVGEQLGAILKVASQRALLRLYLGVGEQQGDEGYPYNQQYDEAKAYSHRKIPNLFKISWRLDCTSRFEFMIESQPSTREFTDHARSGGKGLGDAPTPERLRWPPCVKPAGRGYRARRARGLHRG